MPESPAAWDALLATVVPAASLFAVGGRVRDDVRTELDGVARPVKDLDYVVTGLELRELVECLARVGRADVVGAAFAVVKLTVDGETVDVALPRREASTGSGHRDFTVEAGPAIPLGDDLGRRDFRMNMIARSVATGELVDPFDGRADIAARRIDLLRPDAFVEDPLRMLRACQFAARFDFAVTPATLAAMTAAAPLVTTVSPERIRDELLKLVVIAQRPSVGLELMRATGLLDRVVPELAEGIGVTQNEYHAFDVYGHALASVDGSPPGDPVLRVAALLHDVGKPRTKDGPHFYNHDVVGAEMAAAILERLRLSAEQIDVVAGLIRHHMYATGDELTESAIRRFIKRVGPPHLARQFALRHADIVGSGLPKRGGQNERFEARVAAELMREPVLGTRGLAVDGNDVLAALATAGALASGRRGSPRVGEILALLLEDVLDDPARNERSNLLVRVRELAAVSCETLGD